jgi:3-isopropylmalate/(R)-2-methylmalate dehydratase large subunit
MIAPDETTFRYLKGRPYAPKGDDWDAALAWWKTLRTDEGATFDKSVVIDASKVEPTVTWGTSPEDTVAIGGVVPDPASFADPGKQRAARASLDYMGLTRARRWPSRDRERVHRQLHQQPHRGLCARRGGAQGPPQGPGVKWAIVVPGSGWSRSRPRPRARQGVHRAGLEWREPGCSACLGMNPDKVPPGERCASTSNRNFVGRQGPGARTHLVSPAMAAAAAVMGKLTDVA